jgi:hypothetical protein
LMWFIAIFAVAFVSLRTPTRIWANAWFTIALAAVTLAVPAAIVSRGERRAFWIGFAVCGGVYFLFALAPVVDRLASHQLVTTTLLDLAASQFVDNAYLLSTQNVATQSPARPTPWQDWNLPDFQVSGNSSWVVGYVSLHSPFLYLRIGHAVCCVLAAGAGAEFARYLWLKGEAKRAEQDGR